jgi:hypothetical protein
MIWGAISKNWRPPLVLNERGVKINAEYNKTEVLEKILLPATYFYFQQDEAPSYWYVVILTLGRYCNGCLKLKEGFHKESSFNVIYWYYFRSFSWILSLIIIR